MKPVVDLLRGGYFPGFDRNQEYLFRRGAETTGAIYRLCDQGPYFDVANLFWDHVPANPWDAFTARNGIVNTPPASRT